MSLSQEDRDALDKRDTLTTYEGFIVELAFKDMYYRARQYSLQLATDDRAAELEAAFIRFIFASRPA